MEYPGKPMEYLGNPLKNGVQHQVVLVIIRLWFTILINGLLKVCLLMKYVMIFVNSK